VKNSTLRLDLNMPSVQLTWLRTVHSGD